MYKSPQGNVGKVVGDDKFFAIVEELVSEGKEVIMMPKGNSMLPFIRNGRDSVCLRKLDREAEVGDILLVRTGPKFLMHRVFAVSGEKITLMGDGNVRGKEYCRREDVIAIVTEIRKEGGKVVRPGKGRVWRMLLPVRRYILAIYKRLI